MTNRTYISIGTNLGNRLENITKSIFLLKRLKCNLVLQSSRIYETLPWGKRDQPLFLNMILEIKTTLNPFQLLKVLLEIEKKMGRIRTEKWGPRLIDLDIILYGAKIIDTPELQIPHPGMLKRDFVVFPLLELNPTLTYPGSGIQIKNLVNNLSRGLIEYSEEGD